MVDFIDESYEQAIQLKSVPVDQRGPLHGVPISLKECFLVKGYDHTIGMARWIDCPAPEDGVMVQAIKDFGGVPFCLTNVPQTMYSYACSNPVFGATTHPKDKARTPGGSSGGEACLIAQGGSILGLGSDVGGSLRIPSHFCGIAALKPTSGRIYEAGRDRGGAVGVHSNAGFMCKSVDGVILGMRLLLEDPYKMSEADHGVVPLKWRPELFNPGRKLKIGWYDSDGFIPATPGCKRAVKVAVDLLAAKGHTVVHYQPADMVELVKDFFRLILADLGANSLEVWKDEVLDQSIEVNNIIYKVPYAVRITVLNLLFNIFSPSMAKLAKCSLHVTADLWKGMKELDQRKTEFLNAWKEQELDILIAPGFVYPAPPLADPARLIPATNLTVIYNVLNLPVGSVPVDVYNEEDKVSKGSQSIVLKTLFVPGQDGRLSDQRHPGTHHKERMRRRCRPTDERSSDRETVARGTGFARDEGAGKRYGF